jgi:glycogen operon protein
VKRLIHIRQTEPVFRRNSFYRHGHDQITGVHEVVWLHPEGRNMTHEDWHNPFLRNFGVLIEGQALVQMDRNGDLLIGNSLLFLINGGDDTTTFSLPSHRTKRHWEILLDTDSKTGQPLQENLLVEPGQEFSVQGRQIVLFRLCPPPEEI